MEGFNVATTLNVMSLCSGVGGLDLGVRLAFPNARTVVYVEREGYACEILLSRMEEGRLDPAPVWTDIKSFDGSAWRKKVDILIGGYPCQPFSVAGKRLGEEDPRHLWPYVARTIRDCAPPIVFFENVAGHLSKGLREVRSDLERMGYQVKAGLYRAEEVGAPHKRERLFILGVANTTMADSDNIRRFRERLSVSKRGSFPNGINFERSGNHTWPPSPNQTDAWLNWDGPQPAVCRDADGVGARVDRLRACGNGVVPQQAAYALQNLMLSL